MAQADGKRAFRVGVAGPVGSGKTALVDRVSRKLWPKYNLAVVTNDIYTKEDAEFLLRQGVLPAERGGTQQFTATGTYSDDSTQDLSSAVTWDSSDTSVATVDGSGNVTASSDGAAYVWDVVKGQRELLLVGPTGAIESAAFSPELVDVWIYVIDVAEGDKIPRKGGPGITRSDLLVINKIDLAPHVGASLEVMERDSRRMRGERIFLFTNLRADVGLDEVIAWLEEKLGVPASLRRMLTDAHAPYVGVPHTHGEGSHSHAPVHGQDHEQANHSHTSETAHGHAH